MNKKYRLQILIMFGLVALGLTIPLRAEPYAFPVPFVQKNHTQIFFKDLPGEGSIKISTITGEEVITLSIPPGQGMIPWDVKNSAGKTVATGVYYYLIDAAGQTTLGKLVVIR